MPGTADGGAGSGTYRRLERIGGAAALICGLRRGPISVGLAGNHGGCGALPSP